MTGVHNPPNISPSVNRIFLSCVLVHTLRFILNFFDPVTEFPEFREFPMGIPGIPDRF